MQAETNPNDGFVVGIGGSDAHITNDVGYGAFVYCYMDFLSTTNIREAVKEGHCVVSVGPFVEFSLNGAMIGDKVDVFFGINTLNLSADSTGFGNLDNITILIDGVVDTVVNVSGTFYSGVVDVNLNSGDSYVRVEVYTDAADDNRAFTNPIWVNVSTLTSPAPNINSISATPLLQGFGENVTITAEINGSKNIDTVLVGITPFGESQTNHTMEYVSGNVWQHKFTDFTNGTYAYVVYVNDSSGLTDSDSGTFEMYADLFVNIQTLKDNYVGGELVKITDPPDKEEKKELWFETEETNAKNVNDIVINDEFAHLKGFKQVEFTVDYNGLAVKSFDKEIVMFSSEEKLKNRFRAQTIEVESIYEEVDTGFFNVDERPVKQTYILKNLLNRKKDVKLNVLYEIDSDFVIWNGAEYSIADEPVYFKAFEITEELFSGLNETFLAGHILYFGNNYYDFKDVVDLDYVVSVYSLNGKSYIGLEVNGEIDALGEFVVDPVIGWTSHLITGSVNRVYDVFAIDLDLDGDIDVLSASMGDDKIAWYENNGNEVFTVHVIGSPNAPWSVYAIDVDKDGDVDVLSASTGDDKIAWYENDGSESFTSHTIATSIGGAISVFAIDVDSDGDVDALSASWYSDKIAWYESDLTDDESKIRNDGMTNVSVYLLMKVQYWDGDDWLDEAVIYDASVPIRIQPGEDNQLKLDAIWNPNAWNTSGSESGTYRVYVAVTDENNVVLEDGDGVEIEARWGFGVVN